MGRRRRQRGPHDADGLGEPRLSVVGTFYKALLGRLEADPRVRDAALIGEVFGLDPVAVLDEPKPFRRLLRVAAHNVVQDERERAEKRAAAAAQARRRGRG